MKHSRGSHADDFSDTEPCYCDDTGGASTMNPLNRASQPIKRARSVPAPTKPSKYPLIALCRAAGLPAPASEYRFAPPRRWRADYCWPEYRLIVEVDGGVFVQGRHSRGAGILGDMEKLNAAAILGYRVLKYVPRQLKTTAIADLTKILV